MQMSQVQERLDRIEQRADEARAAMRGHVVDMALRECVDRMHRQARELRDAVGKAADRAPLLDQVDRLEQAGDRAQQACRGAGGVDPQVQAALQRARDEIADLKRQLH